VFNRDLKLIFACNLIGSFGDGLFAYLLPRYMDKSLGASSVEIGILYAVLNLCAALTLLVAGMLADKYDRKKIMIAGWLAWLPAPLIFSLAGNWLQMVPGMVMWGFWLGGPTSTAYILTSAEKNRMTLTFATMSAAWSIGYIFSPALGGYLAGVVGMRVVFYLSFLLYAVACLTLFFIRSQHATKGEKTSTEEQFSLSRLLRIRRLQILSVFFASLMFVLMMFRPFVVNFLTDVYGYGDFEIGILGSVSFASSAVLGLLLGGLGDRSKKAYALTLSIALGSISSILLLISGNFMMLILTFFFAGGSYATWSLLSAIVGPLAPESCRARWIAVPQTVSMFASFIAPYLGGFLYATSPQYPFIIAVVAMLPLAFLSLTKLFKQ